MVFKICYWHLRRFHPSQDRRISHWVQSTMQWRGAFLNGLHASIRAAVSHSSGDRTKIANPDGERHKGMGCGACETLRETSGKQEDNTKWSLLFSFSVPKIRTTQNENTVRLFKLINYNFCHLIRKPLCGLHKCRECTRRSVSPKPGESPQKIKACEQKALQDDDSQFSSYPPPPQRAETASLLLPLRPWSLAHRRRSYRMNILLQVPMSPKRKSENLQTSQSGLRKKVYKTKIRQVVLPQF